MFAQQQWLRWQPLGKVPLGGAEANTNCFSPVTQSGDWYGAPTSAELSPNTASDSTLIYSYLANSVTGEIIIRFGAAGNGQLTNTNLIFHDFGGYNVELFWDDTNLYYSGTNLEAATDIKAAVGTEKCFAWLAVPYVAVDHDYSAVETET